MHGCACAQCPWYEHSLCLSQDHLFEMSTFDENCYYTYPFVKMAVVIDFANKFIPYAEEY